MDVKMVMDLIIIVTKIMVKEMDMLIIINLNMDIITIYIIILWISTIMDTQVWIITKLLDQD